MDNVQTLNLINVRARRRIVHKEARSLGETRACGAIAIRSMSGSAPACSRPWARCWAAAPIAWSPMTTPTAAACSPIWRAASSRWRERRRLPCAISGPTPTSSASPNSCRLYAAAARPVEAIVALGGGSVMDAAKVLAAANGDFARVKHFLETGQDGDALGCTPIVAIPTTAGTGSEVTCWATVWDTERMKKYSLSRETALSRGGAGRSAADDRPAARHHHQHRPRCAQPCAREHLERERQSRFGCVGRDRRARGHGGAAAARARPSQRGAAHAAWRAPA